MVEAGASPEVNTQRLVTSSELDVNTLLYKYPMICDKIHRRAMIAVILKAAEGQND